MIKTDFANNSDRMPTNVRLLAILEVFAEAGRPLTPTEVNAGLNLPKQSIHRLCQTLEQEGFLIRDDNPKRLRPARRARVMASGLLGLTHKHIVRHQILERVAHETGETINFAVAEARGMTYLDRIETNWPLRIQFPIGSHVPFHCTASGKTFLASLSGLDRQRLVEQLTLDAKTDHTVTDAAELLAQLDEVQRLGYATDNVEYIEDSVAFAVPITDMRGNFCASIGCQSPIYRHTLADLLQFVPLVQTAASELAKALFDAR